MCRLQKPARIYAEKSLENISSDIYDDNYALPKTQIEWEETCFLDKSYHGYYTWPKTIKYVLNKRARYTQENMPEQVVVLYNQFSDKNFLVQVIELMILDENNKEADLHEELDEDLDEARLSMFKVDL